VSTNGRSRRCSRGWEGRVTAAGFIQPVRRIFSKQWSDMARSVADGWAWNGSRAVIPGAGEGTIRCRSRTIIRVRTASSAN